MADFWPKSLILDGRPTKGNLSIEIYMDDTVEEAVEARQNTPLYKTGFQFDEKYLEWTPADGRHCVLY